MTHAMESHTSEDSHSEQVDIALFAAVLKEARLSRRVTQKELAQMVGASLRTVISWENGVRLPTPGALALLVEVLSKEGFSLAHPLVSAYFVEEVTHQVQREDGLQKLGERVIRRLSAIQTEQIPPPIEQMPQLSLEPDHQTRTQPETTSDEIRGSEELQGLFALLDQFRRHPHLIRVIQDFLKEVSPGDLR